MSKVKLPTLYLTLLYLSLGNLFSQQIPLQTFASAGGATGGGTTPSYFASIGQPFVIGRPVSTNTGGGVMTANEFMFATSTVVAALPAAQPTALVFSNVTASSLTVSFTAATGSPAGYIVIRKSSSAPVSVPAISVSYNIADTFGDATVAYVGTGTSFNDSGLSAATTYYYEVFSFNGTGASIDYLTTNPLSGNQTTTVVDTTPPSITDNTASTVDVSIAITITATITDTESSISSATVEYRSVVSGGATTIKALTLSSGSYSASIAATEIGELGIEYKISATSSGGTATTGTTFKTVKLNYPAASNGLEIPNTLNGSDISDYQIIAIPLTLTANTVRAVISDDLGTQQSTTWRMFHYDNNGGTAKTNELAETSTLDPGVGYWLISKNGGQIFTGGGTTVQASSDAPFQISLQTGWNQIGNPYNFNLLWSDVQAANSGLPGLRIYNLDFKDGTRLDKITGGFVKVTAPQTLVFPTTKNSSVNGRNSSEANQNRNTLDNPNWLVKFILQQDDLTNTISGFGMNENASAGFDVYDGFNMPRFFDKYLVLNHAKKEGDDYYSSDIVPTTANHVWDFFVESTAAGRLISIQWDNSYFGQNAKELYLVDVNLQRAIDMRNYNMYQLDKNVSQSFKIVYGDPDFVQEKIAVQEMVLHAIWPNPASTDATISFSLPELSSAQSVEFSLTDLLGRTIWINQSNYSSGYHEVLFRRSIELTAGVYIVRLSSGSTVKQARLVFK